MICFDTNVVIYLGNKTLSENVIGDEPVCYASVSLIEALGFPDILAGEEQRIQELFETMIDVPLSTTIIQTAIRLRQLNRMSLGDSIVAATALENDCELWTANIEDFDHVDGLRLRNPLKPESSD